MENKSFNVLKIEKLSRAVYLVTDFMSDREPLKWELRQLALDTISLLPGGENNNQSDGLIQLIQKIIALIDLSLATGGVSQMNFALLRKEYSNLLGLLESESLKSLNQGLKVDPMLPTPAISTATPPVSNVSDNAVSNVSDKSFATSNKDILDKNQRQQQILAHLKGKGWLSIKDIADTLPNFSSKTVQRELLELVDKGLLKKRGERRWSRYSLI